jgi:Zn-dependent membrane protease YugP
LVIIVPGYILFLIGFAMAYPELARGLAAIAGAFIVFGILAVPINLKLSRKYQRQIDELDALPKES